MLLRELKEEVGTYVGVVPTEASTRMLAWWAEANRLEVLDDYHTTVIYSRVPVNVILRPGVHITKPKGFQLFGDCLVLELDAPTLTARHLELMAAGATYDYDVYVPHITLGKGFSSIPNVIVPDFKIAMCGEYSEDLDLTDD